MESIKKQHVNAKMLKAVRDKLGINQDEMGRRLGVHRPDISKIERGLETPDWLFKFAALAKALHDAGMTWEDVVMNFPEPVDRVAEESGKYKT
jgi:DNA-binding XRE family transcriptional regulator